MKLVVVICDTVTAGIAKICLLSLSLAFQSERLPHMPFSIIV